MGAPTAGAPIIRWRVGVRGVTGTKLDAATNTRGQEWITIPCAFCRGRGKDPFDLLSEHALCEVCGGSGQVTVREPIHRCAFCGGTGVFPRSRLTCTSCMGRGVVTIEEPVEACQECLGAGVVAGHSLPCSTCGGKGRVTVARGSGVRRPR